MRTGILVWDLPVRLFHWLLAVAILGAWVTHKMGTGAFGWHRWFGYASLVLVAFRVVWGFVGPRHARFTDFLRGPAAVWRYAHDWLSPRAVSAPRATIRSAAGWSSCSWCSLLLKVLPGSSLMTRSSAPALCMDTFPMRPATNSPRGIACWPTRCGMRSVCTFVAIAAYLVLRRENLIGPMITGRKSGSWVPADARQYRARAYGSRC